MYNTHLKEVTDRVKKTPGIVPAHRKAYKQGYSFSSLPFDEQLKLWDHIWRHGDNFWVMLQSFFFLEQHMKHTELLPQIWNTTVHWQEQVNDWGLCDCLAKIYTKALEVEPTTVYRQLQEWNTSENLWNRRQSLVSLLYFSGTKQEYLPFAKIKGLVTPLLGDKEYYVQKGLGWCLREMHTIYPEQTYTYLQKKIKSISAIAFTIAIEKMNAEEKAVLKSMRKRGA